MSSKEEPRIFVGGLSWDTTERHLQDAFSRFGKIIDTQIMVERETGRSRGFGFVTFIDSRATEDAIAEMHGQDLGGRSISVNRAEPRIGSDDGGYGRGGGYSSGGRGSYRGGDVPPFVGNSDCFRCGRPGHWARDCPSAGGGDGDRFSSRPRFSGGGGRVDRYSGSDGGRYGDRDRIDSRDRYSGGRDRYSDRYPISGDGFSGDRYPHNGYGEERAGGSDRYKSDGPSRYQGSGSYIGIPGPYDPPSRGGSLRLGIRGPYDPPSRVGSLRLGPYDPRSRDGSDRYKSGGPSRYKGVGSYKERPGPYVRPSRDGRQSSYEDSYV